MTDSLVLRFIEIVTALGALVGYLRGKLNSMAKDITDLDTRVTETEAAVKRLKNEEANQQETVDDEEEE